MKDGRYVYFNIMCLSCRYCHVRDANVITVATTRAISQDIVLFAFSRMYSISTFLTQHCIHFLNYDLKIIMIIILTI